ncbi:unknown [Corallococcus sp. CAG:1435]|nr:unknown [Corallococcus sp. CAG:1435]
MGISERRQHTAEVCSHILHYKHKGKFVTPVATVHCNETEGQKGDESHVVGENHRTDVGYQHQRKNHPAQRAESQHDFLCQPGKEAYVFVRSNNGKRAKKRCQSFQVEVSEVLFVKGYKKAGYRCGKHRNNRHQMPLNKTTYVNRPCRMIMGDFSGNNFCRHNSPFQTPFIVVLFVK